MRRALRIPIAVSAVVATVATTLVLAAAPALADPSAAAWAALRQCESSGRYATNTGNGYYGAYQFDLPTWRSVGGSGYPHQASPAEQDYRALRLYRERGWEPWVCAALAGLSEDGDAGSGVLPPVPGNQSGGGSAPGPAEGGGSVPTGAPAYPGRQFREGDSSESLKLWQKQMGTRGYGLVGTGYFGPKTKAAVLDLQTKAGLNVVGFIGPKTWAAAWSTPAAPAAPAAPAPTDTYTAPTDASCGVGNATAPAYPGRQFVQGDTARELACFQRQLGRRGYGLSGTGYYGSATKNAVVSLQQRNGINPSGIIGPQTWVAAWEGA